jgi:hypothetical protein
MLLNNERTGRTPDRSGVSWVWGRATNQNADFPSVGCGGLVLIWTKFPIKKVALIFITVISVSFNTFKITKSITHAMWQSFSLKPVFSAVNRNFCKYLILYLSE